MTIHELPLIAHGEPASDEISIAAQINVAQVRLAAELGYRSIICNRPDEENGDGQTPHRDIALACARHGLTFTYFPVGSGEHTEQQVRDMREYIDRAPKPVLVYCRTGRRSTRLIQAGEALLDLYHPESFG